MVVTSVLGPASSTTTLLNQSDPQQMTLLCEWFEDACCPLLHRQCIRVIQAAALLVKRRAFCAASLLCLCLHVDLVSTAPQCSCGPSDSPPMPPCPRLTTGSG
jgi:hypothetical protein